MMEMLDKKMQSKLKSEISKTAKGVLTRNINWDVMVQS